MVVACSYKILWPKIDFLIFLPHFPLSTGHFFQHGGQARKMQKKSLFFCRNGLYPCWYKIYQEAMRFWKLFGILVHPRAHMTSSHWPPLFHPMTRFENEVRIYCQSRKNLKVVKWGWKLWNGHILVYIYHKQCGIKQKNQWKSSNGQLQCFSKGTSAT